LEVGTSPGAACMDRRTFVTKFIGSVTADIGSLTQNLKLDLTRRAGELYDSEPQLYGSIADQEMDFMVSGGDEGVIPAELVAKYPKLNSLLEDIYA